MLYILIACLLFIALLYFGVVFAFKKNKRNKYKPMPEEHKVLLRDNVAFYNSLTPEEKISFEERIQDFLANCRVTAISCTITELDSLLVAASAIIPVFSFPSWRYYNLEEVLIYPDRFNQDYNMGTSDSNILGMVGSGVMNGKMILSKKALREGFSIENDKRNTAIHEFVHLIDKSDGVIDGVPSALLQKQYTIPWIDLIKRKIEDIAEDNSDINPYGGTNNAEFFSVASEYFFERPKLLQEKHPELYKMMEKIFSREMSKKELTLYHIKSVGRNDPCPCGSGKKYKKCCKKKRKVTGR